MELLPDEDERTQLIDRLAALILAAGSDMFVAAPLIEPDDRWFPDLWTPDVAGVERLLRRLLAFAGLGFLELVLEVDRFAEPTLEVDARGRAQVIGHQGAAAWYSGGRRGIAVFGVDTGQLDDPAGLVGTLAHEVAHAYRTAHDLRMPETALEERLTDLTTVYLGFGILTVNASQRFRSGSDGGHGAWYASAHGGYLSPQAMSYLLAAHAVARGDAPGPIARALATNQRACFKAAVKELGDRDALIARLGLPLPTLWPARAETPKRGWLRRLFS